MTQLAHRRCSTTPSAIARLLLAPLVALAAGCAAAPAPRVESAAPAPRAATVSPSDPTTPATFLALSDVHFGSKTGDSWYCYLPHHCQGIAQCETNSALWTAAQAEARGLIQAHKPSFVVYLGDLPAHCEPADRRGGELGTVLDGLQSIAGSDTRLIYLPGNNDSIGPDYCTFTAEDPGDNNRKKTPFDFASQPGAWPVINARQGDIISDTHLSKGYYSVYPLGKPSGTTQPALRLIALNTVIFTAAYPAGCETSDQRQQDANAQIDWLAGQLDNAGNDKVILAMHVPPGVDGYGGGSMWAQSLDYTWKEGSTTKSVWVQQKFLEIVGKHSDKIVALLTSHTHTNGIRRIRDCQGNFVELGLSVPAITTDHANNPAIQLFSFGDGFELSDRQTFWASSNTDFWSQGDSFTFRQTYECPSCPVTDSMYQRIQAIGGDATKDAKIVDAMRGVLLTGHGTASARCYQEALDVTCSPVTCSP